jgi:hypothetical protein
MLTHLPMAALWHRLACMTRRLAVFVALGILTGCSAPPPPSSPPSLPPSSALSLTPLAAYSSEFSTADELSKWQTLHDVEGDPDWIGSLDVNSSDPGALYLVPRSCAWFEEHKGVFLHQNLAGDALLHLRLRARGATAEDPVRKFSLGGPMIRVPDQANWLFITAGTGDRARQIEVKSTKDGVSDPSLLTGVSGWVELVLARSGSTIISMYRPDGGTWRVTSRWSRPDLPASLQWGIAAYTDWDSLGLPETQPDLRLSVDFARFYRPSALDTVAPDQLAIQLGGQL